MKKEFAAPEMEVYVFETNESIMNSGECNAFSAGDCEPYNAQCPLDGINLSQL